MAANTPSSTPAPAQAGDGVDISASRARQAFPGKRIVWILVTSLVAVVAAFILAFVTNSPQRAAEKSGNGRVNDPAVAERFNAPEPQSKQPG